MDFSLLFLSSLPLQTTPRLWLQSSARDLLVCLLGRVESPSKRNAVLLSRVLDRDGQFGGWLEREEERTGIGVSSEPWNDSAPDGSNRRRFPMSGCFTGEVPELRVFTTLHSLSSSGKDLAYPYIVSIVLSILKVSIVMQAFETFSLILWPSKFVLVALGFTLFYRFGKAKPCSFYAHGSKNGTKLLSLATGKGKIKATVGGIIEPCTFEAVFYDFVSIKADGPAKGHPLGI
ncbi:hypothetical protein GQ457_13G019490 [Hibiscus cannabinus]